MSKLLGIFLGTIGVLAYVSLLILSVYVLTGKEAL